MQVDAPGAWRRSTATALIGLAIVVSAACKADELTSSASPSSRSTPSPQLTTIEEPTESESVPSTTIPTPQVIGTPLDARPVAEGASLFTDIEFPVRSHDALDSLPSGMYFLESSADSDASTELLAYVSAQSGERGLLQEAGEIVFFRKAYLHDGAARILAGSPFISRFHVFIPSLGTAKAFDRCQDRRPVGLSPSGGWMATICTPVDEPHGGTVVVEVISLIDGTATEILVNTESDRRFGSDFIHWVADESFVASLGPNDEPCLLDLADHGMRCAPGLAGKEVASSDGHGRWLLVYRRDGSDPRYWNAQDVYSFDCFNPSSSCDPVAQFDEEFASNTLMYWSPDATKLAVDSGDRLTSSTARFGYFGTDDWSFHELAVLSSDHVFFDWCPDGTCMVIVGDPTYLLYLDGTLEELPVELTSPIQLIKIP